MTFALIAAAAWLALAGDPPKDTYDNAWPQWSPDAKRIVFASTRDGGDWEIYTMAADGSDARRLTSSKGRDAHPAFTRDGKRILFQSPRGSAVDMEVDLYWMDLSGDDVRRLVATGGFDGVPVPSPDGRWIAFQRGDVAGDAFHWDLFLVNAEGKQERRLTNEAWSSQVPTWNPDGKLLAIYANPDGRDQLYLLEVASAKVRPLTTSAYTDETPSYSPDGRYVAFVSNRDGGRDLYRLEVTTGEVKRLTSGVEVWAQASWSPDGRRILFSARRRGFMTCTWSEPTGETRYVSRKGPKASAEPFAPPGTWRTTSSLRSDRDPKAEIREIPPLLAQEGSEDGEAPEPRHLFLARRGREARTRRAVLQARVTNLESGRCHREEMATGAD